MKKRLLMQLLTMFLVVGFMFPLYANAGIIGNVNLHEYYSSPTGYATFPSGIGNWYLDYDVSLDGGAAVEAFCVEDADGPSETEVYTLLTIDSGLTDFGLDAPTYLAAAWVADYYYANYEGTTTSEEAYKAGAQIAVWEIIYDYDGSSSSWDLTSGSFSASSANNNYTDEAGTIWGSKPSAFPGSNSNWALAVNPTIVTGGTVTSGPWQNYLVRYSVPDASIMFLIGPALLGLGVLGRRKSKSA